ncbi:MAG: FAD-dependent oxidoreductase [Phycisphaeraceae bacterium]
MALPGHHAPYWAVNCVCEPSPPLKGDHQVDVVVVGAGITGLTTAMQLLAAGKRVAVVEMHRVGGGTTGHSSGHVDGQVDAGFTQLLEHFPLDQARLAVEAKLAAIEHVEAWVREYGINCDFQRVGAYYYGENEADDELIGREYEASRKLDVDSDLREKAPLPFGTTRALHLPAQARIDPYSYVCGLAEAFVERGGDVFEHTRAEDIEDENGLCHVATNRGVLRCEHVVLAAHAPLMARATLQTRALPHQSYMLVARVAEEVPDALCWDTARPYHYLRLAETGKPNLLMVGGADHHTGAPIDTHEHARQLERYVRERFDVDEIISRWSHEFWEPADTLPYIGLLPGQERIYIGTGFSGDGLAMGTVAGIVISEEILERHDERGKVFNPSRTKLATSAKQAASTMLNTARHFVGDRIGGGEVDSIDAIAPGEGAIVRVEGRRLAVYRDEQGELHARSPVCQHLGCIVHWNGEEKTWDCPCHGGRYEATGDVIMGPPTSPLPKMKLPGGQA